jgi:hypothetical protein
MVIKLIILAILLINSKITSSINGNVQPIEQEKHSGTSLIPLDEWFTRVSDPTFKCIDHEEDLGLGLFFYF